jgi:DNA-binding GntR family transcriptional regulator
VITETEPEYRRLMDDIRSKITGGEYPVGQPIPSTRKLHEQTGVSVPVVRRAVQELQKDGILAGQPGKGVFVLAIPEDAAREQQDVAELGRQVAGLRSEMRTLAERVDSVEPSDIREALGRLEDILIDLYGKLGFDYPHEATSADTGAASETAAHERLG